MYWMQLSFLSDSAIKRVFRNKDIVTYSSTAFNDKDVRNNPGAIKSRMLAATDLSQPFPSAKIFPLYWRGDRAGEITPSLPAL